MRALKKSTKKLSFNYSLQQRIERNSSPTLLITGKRKRINTNTQEKEKKKNTKKGVSDLQNNI